MNITKKIERLRKEKGLSIARLAREADIPTVSLRVMLARENVNNYNVLALIKIAKILDVTVSYLVSEEFEESKKPKLSQKQKAKLEKRLNKAITKFFNVEFLSKTKKEKLE